MSKRILLVRLSAIGDVVQTLPVLCALRERYPAAWITWVVEHRAANLLEGHAALDELIVVPHGFLRSPRKIWQLAGRLRAGRFELAIDAQGLSKSALVAWLSGARRRIGFGRPWGRELSRWLNSETIDTTAPHPVDRNLELLRPLGIDKPPVRFQVPETNEDRQVAEVLIQRLSVGHGFAMGSGFAMIAPGAGWPSKRWPPQRFAAVAEYLVREQLLPVVVIWGNEQEYHWACQVAASAGEGGMVAPPLTLRQLAALARRARFFLGGDTGPLHLAAAVGTPCVALFGPWPAAEFGPYGPGHVTVQKNWLEGSSRHRRRASAAYMEAITVEMAIAACEHLLAQHRQPAAKAG